MPKLIILNDDGTYQEILTISESLGASDAGKLVELNNVGKFDTSVIPALNSIQTGAIDWSGVQTFSNATAASSTSTGAVVIPYGGIGVGGKSYFGDTLSRGGSGTPSVLPNLLYQGWNTLNTYIQSNIQNLSAGESASGDYVISHDQGSDVSGFIDMGMNSSGYSSATWTVNGHHDGYLYTADSNLAIGVGSEDLELCLFTGGTLATNKRLTLTDSLITFLNPVSSTYDISALTFTGSGANLTDIGPNSLLVGGSNGQIPSVNGSGGWSWVSPAVNPMSSIGDLIVGGVSGASSRLPVGAEGTVLTVTSGSPSWQVDDTPSSSFIIAMAIALG